MAQTASLRASAQIIPLPGAATAPVVNTRFPGRWPSIVVPFNRFQRLRWERAQQIKQAKQSPQAQDAQAAKDGAIKMLSIALKFLQEGGHV